MRHNINTINNTVTVAITSTVVNNGWHHHFTWCGGHRSVVRVAGLSRHTISNNTVNDQGMATRRAVRTVRGAKINARTQQKASRERIVRQAACRR